jgi:hypothetical protein
MPDHPEAAVVEVKSVRGRAVGKRCALWRRAVRRADKPRARRATFRSSDLLEDATDRLLRPGDRHTEPVQQAVTRPLDVLGSQVVERECRRARREPLRETRSGGGVAGARL